MRITVLEEQIMASIDGDVTPFGEFWEDKTAIYDGEDMIFVYGHDNDTDTPDETFTVEIRVYKGEFDK